MKTINLLILFVTGVLILALSALKSNSLPWIIFVSSMGVLSILIRVHLSHKSPKE